MGSDAKLGASRVLHSSKPSSHTSDRQCNLLAPEMLQSRSLRRGMLYRTSMFPVLCNPICPICLAMAVEAPVPWPHAPNLFQLGRYLCISIAEEHAVVFSRSAAFSSCCWPSYKHSRRARCCIFKVCSFLVLLLAFFRLFFMVRILLNLPAAQSTSKSLMTS